MLSDFADWNSAERRLTFDLPLQIEPKLYPVTLTLDNGLITKNYILSVIVLELKAPYFIEEEWLKV